MAGSATGSRLREPLMEAHGRNSNGELLVLGASFRTADLEFRERLARYISTKGLKEVQALPEVKESALLSTCNRLELYLVAESVESVQRLYSESLKRAFPDESLERKTYVFSGPEAIAHLFRVAAGLDSIVLGEPQILSQVRSAGIASRKANTAKGILSPLFDRASRVGRRARDTYQIGSGEASLSDLAVEVILESNPGPLKVLLIGTGKMVQLAAKRLKGSTSRFYVASKRKDVPRGLDGARLIRYGDIPRVAARCDVVISATTVNRPLLNQHDFGGRKLHTIVDLGMPRNVSGSVRDLSNVRLIDLDDLARIGRKGKRSADSTRAEAAITREASEFHSWLLQTRLSSTLSDLFSWANGIRDDEVTRASRRLAQTDPRQRHIVEAMARRIVSKLMARPLKFVRQKYGALTDEEKLDLLRSVFGIDDDNEANPAPRN